MAKTDLNPRAAPSEVSGADLCSWKNSDEDGGAAKFAQDTGWDRVGPEQRYKQARPWVLDSSFCGLSLSAIWSLLWSILSYNNLWASPILTQVSPKTRVHPCIEVLLFPLKTSPQVIIYWLSSCLHHSFISLLPAKSFPPTHTLQMQLVFSQVRVRSSVTLGGKKQSKRFQGWKRWWWSSKAMFSTSK